MSPAKMFAFMKKKEHKTQKLEAHISNSRRDLFGEHHDSTNMPIIQRVERLINIFTIQPDRSELLIVNKIVSKLNKSIISVL